MPSSCSRHSSLLSDKYVATLQLKVWQLLRQREDTILPVLRAYLLPGTQGVWSHSKEALVLLMMLVVWSDIPAPGQLNLTPQCRS